MVLTPYPAVNDLITMLGQKSSNMICNPIKKHTNSLTTDYLTHFYLNILPKLIIILNGTTLKL